MKQITVTFDDDGSIKKDYGGCDLREISLASKVLEADVLGQLNMQNIKSNVGGLYKIFKEYGAEENDSVQTLISCLKTLTLPFAEETEDNFDKETALKMLPISLNCLIKQYS